MSCEEEQATEWEVLDSIYEGDVEFKKISATKLQYKFGTDTERPFLIEIEWPDEYPTVACNINMDVFYNQQMPENLRKSIKDRLLAVAEENVGMASTYTVIEFAKENCAELVSEWTLTKNNENTIEGSRSANPSESRREPLTKAAKRRMWDRNEGTGFERGHDWIDILKHLNQV